MKLKFIQDLEDCKLTAYQDIAGVWTIGYGSTHYSDGRAVKSGDFITQMAANDLFGEVAENLADDLRRIITKPLNVRQETALVSLVYNIGLEAFRNSTLRRTINYGGTDVAIGREWKRWNKAHVDGKLVAVKGLTARRTREFRLWTNKIKEFM